jgi:hypothetical protein
LGIIILVYVHTLFTFVWKKEKKENIQFYGFGIGRERRLMTVAGEQFD